MGGFTVIPPGMAGPAQLTQKISAGDTLVAINKESVRSLSFDQQVQLMGKAASPVFLSFKRKTVINLMP